VNGEAAGVVPATEEIMCPFCIGSVVLLAGSLMSTGGLTTLVVMKLGAKNGAKESVQKPNPKEETWAK
jgi:hypothetical protein